MSIRLANWLGLPLEFRTVHAHILRFASAFSLFIFIFLLFYKPFFIAQLSGARLWSTCGLIAGFTWTCIYTNHHLVITHFQFITTRWTLGRELIWSAHHFILIGLFNVLLVRYILHLDVSALAILGDTAFVGIIPVIIDLVQRSKSSIQQPQSSELLYVKSDGNYIHIFESEGQQTKRQIVRSPLYKFKDRNRNRLVQVHKQYLVNASAVRDVCGNSNGGHVVLSDDSHIPYSRGFYLQVRKMAS